MSDPSRVAFGTGKARRWPNPPRPPTRDDFPHKKKPKFWMLNGTLAGKYRNQFSWTFALLGALLAGVMMTTFDDNFGRKLEWLGLEVGMDAEDCELERNMRSEKFRQRLFGLDVEEEGATVAEARERLKRARTRGIYTSGHME